MTGERVDKEIDQLIQPTFNEVFLVLSIYVEIVPLCSYLGSLANFGSFGKSHTFTSQ